MFVLLIGFIYFIDKTNQEKDSCLESYALKICQESNLSYFSHSSSGIWCKEDIRDFDFLRFKFNRTEKISCGIGGVALE